ncbi:MAG: NmrA family NAD(P)-binding protein, partial [Acidiferrobacterales bacterium]|nr:NmrA family NAD(P)-binding protein [Acidiferrobacterales bacterium]
TDIDNAESLKQAFRDAYGAYCVTFFWDHFSPEKEQAEARAMAEAAQHAGLKHVIWSTLEDTRRWVPLSDSRMPTLNGQYKVPHFDGKGASDHIFTDLGVPTTFMLTSFYWENFISFGAGPKKGPDGRLTITLPMDDKKLPGIATEDIGRCALGIFHRNGDLIGKTVGIAGEHLTGAQMAAAFTNALGQAVHYNAVSPETYRGFGFPGADDLGNMFQFKRDFNEYYCRARDVDFSRSLNPALQTFDGWLAQNKNRIPLD